MINRFLTIASGIACGAFALGAWAIGTPTPDWKLSGPFGGTATSIAIDPENPKVVLAGGRNSLMFQSQNAGDAWDLINFPKRNLGEVTCILVDPSDSKHYLAGMIAADGAGLFESHDSGQTWSESKDIHDFGVRALAFAPSQPSRFVAGTLRGVMLSDDSGKTWTRISDPENFEMQGITALAVDTKDANIIYAGTPHLPWKTTDGGKTWGSIHTGMIDDSDVFSIYVDPAIPNDIFASACSGIYSSDNRGDLWHKLLGIPNTSRRTHVVREDPAHSGVIYAGTTTGLFRSMNRGGSWKTLTSTQVNYMAFDPSKPTNMYLALEDEGIGKSEDSGDTVKLMDRGFVDRQISSVTVSGSRFYAVQSQDGEGTGLFFSADRGESWSQIQAPRGLLGVHLKTIVGVPGQEQVLLAASGHQMFKSVDSGNTWKPLTMRLVIPPPEEPANPAAAKPVHATSRTSRTRTARVVKPKPQIKDINPSEISALYNIKSGTKNYVFAATDLGLLKSDDTGGQWLMSAIPVSAAITALYSSPSSDGHLIARAPGALFESTDFGDHWKELAFPLPTSDINDIAVPADSSAPIMVATRVGLYLSADDGAKWLANVGGIPASTVNSVIYLGGQEGKQSTAYAVEYGRLYQTKDCGASWAVLPTTLSALHIRQLWIPDYTSGRLYGVTSDLGILFRE